IPEARQAPEVLRRVRAIAATAPAAAGFAQAVVEPVVNALHVGLQGHPRTLAPALQPMRRARARQALPDGPEALDDVDRRQLLADPQQTSWLHGQVWNEQPAVWSQWLDGPVAAKG